MGGRDKVWERRREDGMERERWEGERGWKGGIEDAAGERDRKEGERMKRESGWERQRKDGRERKDERERDRMGRREDS